MLDMWVRAILLLLLVWLIAEHYQQWGKVRGSQPARYRRTGKKRTSKPKGIVSRGDPETGLRRV